MSTVAGIHAWARALGCIAGELRLPGPLPALRGRGSRTYPSVSSGSPTPTSSLQRRSFTASVGVRAGWAVIGMALLPLLSSVIPSAATGWGPLIVSADSFTAARAASGGAGQSETGEWRITPLGPEGADVRRLFPQEDGSCLALTNDGRFYVWAPVATPFGKGYWESVGSGFEGAIALAGDGTSPGGGPLILLENGIVHAWWSPSRWRAWCEGGAASSQPGDRAAGIDSVGTGGASGQGASEDVEPEGLCPSEADIHLGLERGAFRCLGRIPAHAARQAVALLDPGDRRAAGPIVLTRQGDVYAFGVSPVPESWQIRWLNSQGRDYAQDQRLRLIRSARVSPAGDGALFVLTQWEGLFISRDGARTFSPASEELPKEVSAIWACGTHGLGAITPDGLMLSDHADERWRRLGSWMSRDWATHGEIVSVRCVDGGGSPGSELDAGPRRRSPIGRGARLVAVTRQGCLLLSPDDGHTWEPQLQEVPLRVWDMAASTHGPELYLATSRGVLIAHLSATDQWRWQNEGLHEVKILTTRVLPRGHLLVGTNLGVYVFDGAGRSWCPLAHDCAWNCSDEGAAEGLSASETLALRQRLSAPIMAIDLFCAQNGQLFVGLATEEGAAICRVEDQGRLVGWRLLGPRRAVASMVTLSEQEQWLVGFERSRAYLLHIQGDDWEDRSDLLADAGLETPQPSTPHLLRAPQDATQAALLLGEEIHLLSSDRIAPWAAGPRGRPLRAISTSEGIYLATDRGLFLSRASGADWLPAGLDGERVLDVSVADYRPGTIFCRTAPGLLWSEDRGSTWQGVELPPELTITSAEVAYDGVGVFLGSSQGLFQVLPPESRMTIRAPRPVFSSPNPFSHHATLRCYLDGIRTVDLEPSGASMSEVDASDAAGGPSSTARHPLDSAVGSYGGQPSSDPPAPGSSGSGRAGMGADVDAMGWNSGSPHAGAPANMGAGTRGDDGGGYGPWLWGSEGKTGIWPEPETVPGGSGAPEAGFSATSSGDGSLDSSVSQSAATQGEIRIFSVHGQLVRRLVGAQAFSGDSGGAYWEWSWDGRNERGQEAPNGVYLLSTRIGPQNFVGKVVKFR